MTNRAAILLGSNIEPEANLAAALERLDQHEALDVLATSAVYRSDPVGPAGQPPFLNAAVVLETPLPPEELRAELRRIEAQLGRVRSEDRFAPRPIDLDIVLYGDVEADFDGWKLPDPDLELPHVLVPLAEIAPDWVVPGRQESLAELAAQADRSGLTS
ncbi:MAG: 2-amino-4-hydroxy-6-hydroxymethyldihydropteridine diphosphokinase [Acidimicrobiia bacterium]